MSEGIYMLWNKVLNSPKKLFLISSEGLENPMTDSFPVVNDSGRSNFERDWKREQMKSRNFMLRIEIYPGLILPEILKTALLRATMKH